MLGLLPLDGMGRADSVVFAGERIGQFADKEKKPFVPALTALLQKCSENMRYAILEIVSNTPETLMLYKRLQKYNLKAE